MKTFYRMENPIQQYSWGSYDAIAHLTGKGSAETPQAELWMGAHPKASSRIEIDGRWVSLLELIRNDPLTFLGKENAGKYNLSFPFLFKVLAAEKPLSMQTHPDRKKAVTGYARENREGISVNDRKRNYRDDRHKPELICALTPFIGLKGFRKIKYIINAFEGIGLDTDFSGVDFLKKHPDAGGIRFFFKTLLTAEDDLKHRLIEKTMTGIKKLSHAEFECKWIKKLADEYPTDIGILAPLFMNLVRLEPGQAMYLTSGSLHAYLDGTGIELMANSDNVLRGGLTTKHIDVPELLDVLNFEAKDVDIIQPEPISEYEGVYSCPAQEFRLSVIRMPRQGTEMEFTAQNLQIWLCTDGQARLSRIDNGEVFDLVKGASALIVPSRFDCVARGKATLYRAMVP